MAFRGYVESEAVATLRTLVEHVNEMLAPQPALIPVSLVTSRTMPMPVVTSARGPVKFD
jgi:hypothetical protein